MSALLLSAALTAASCSKPSGDPIRALVDEVAAAAEDRDADAVAARLSDAFQGQQALAKADIVAALRRYFAAYESIDLEVFDVLPETADGVTRVRTRVGFTGTAQKAFGLQGLLPPSAVYTFDFDARDEGGVWRVTRASWELAAQGAEAPARARGAAGLDVRRRAAPHIVRPGSSHPLPAAGGRSLPEETP